MIDVLLKPISYDYRIATLFALVTISACSVESTNPVSMNTNEIKVVEVDRRTGNEFKPIMAGDAKLEDGTPYSFHLFERSSSGAAISMRVEMRGSEKNSTAELRRLTTAARQVVQDMSITDERGMTTGRRVLLVLSEQGDDSLAVAWTVGPELNLIEGTSWEDILLFEQSDYAAARSLRSTR